MIILQNLTVKDAYRLEDENPILLKVTDDFSQVIRNFAQHVELRGIFVVDDDNHFMGVITRTDLLDWARVKLGRVLLKPLTDMDKTIRLVTLIGATTVGDILRPETKSAAVHDDNTLDEALRIMVDTDLILLPVLNHSQRVIGSLSLAELLNLSLG